MNVEELFSRMAEERKRLYDDNLIVQRCKVAREAVPVGQPNAALQVSSTWVGRVVSMIPRQLEKAISKGETMLSLTLPIKDDAEANSVSVATIEAKIEDALEPRHTPWSVDVFEVIEEHHPEAWQAVQTKFRGTKKAFIVTIAWSHEPLRSDSDYVPPAGAQGCATQ